MAKPNFTMRLDLDIRALAERVAKAEHRSLTSLIEVAILEYAERHGFTPEQEAKSPLSRP